MKEQSHFKHISELASIRKRCAITLLGLHKKANSGHIGASLSCLEILIYLFFKEKQQHDLVILSKGHAASALYTVLAEAMEIPKNALNTYYKDDTLLAAHPPCSNEIVAIPFGTGSLGHGLSLSTGLAFSQRYTGRSFKVYCVLSDGECNEGSNWEAALFAAHHKLCNLTVIVDVNGLQGFGTTKEVLNTEPLDEKFRAFGFETEIAKNGNCFKSIDEKMSLLSDSTSNNPKCLIARTTKGHGVSYMENQLAWHYTPMSDEQYAVAIKELESIDA